MMMDEPRDRSLSEPSSLDSLRDELVGLRPGEHVEADRIESALAERMFGASAPPMRIGRFEIHHRLGSGGVGVVYHAFDPQLRRHVALKLLRDSSRIGRIERERLLREALALARIKHPNVVTVHEVGQLGDQVFLVMELVEGQNLHAWAHAQRRSWREVLEVYVQAGRGLAAAHAAELVHRDFKPHNAIIGADGRVRVVDFGLARGDAPDSRALTGPEDSGELSGVHASASASATSERLDASLTRPETLLGTPAYMSPEQHERRPVAPASDQFSFCVALYEALCGVRPFDGRSTEELAARVVAGIPSEPPRDVKVPAWLLAIVRRGMSVAPEDRHPSMDRLLEALARDPSQARRRWLGLGTLASLGATVVVLALRGQGPEPCSGSAEELADTWGSTRRAELEARLSSLVDPAVARTLVGTLDGYVEGWRAEHEAACLDHLHGETSDALLDARMLCLAQRRGALEGVLQALDATDAAALEPAIAAVHDLRPLAACSDRELLEADLPLPEDPELRRTVKESTEDLARITALADAGRFDDAQALARSELSRAEALGHRPLVAAALLVLGRIEMETDRGDGTIPAKTLHEAFLAGLAVDDLGLTAEARAHELHVEARSPRGPMPSEDDLATVQAMVQSLPARSPVHGLVLNNAGAIAASQGDYSASHTLSLRAYEARRAVPQPRPIELHETLFNVAITAPDAASQRAWLTEVVAEYERLLGASHRRTLRTRRLLLRTERDPEAALPQYESLCEAFRAHHADELATCLYDRGLRYAEAGRLEEAAGAFEEAASRLASLAGSAGLAGPLRVRHALAHGQALASRGRHGEVVTTLRAVISEEGVEPAQWLRVWLADLGVVLAEALVAEGRPAEALEALASPLAELEARSKLRFDAELERTLVRARLALAHARLDAVPAGTIVPAQTASQVRALLDDAERSIRAAGPGGAWRLRALTTLREDLPASP